MLQHNGTVSIVLVTETLACSVRPMVPQMLLSCGGGFFGNITLKNHYCIFYRSWMGQRAGCQMLRNIAMQ